MPPPAPSPRTAELEMPMEALQRLVNACNQFEDGWSIQDSWAYLCLPDKAENLRIYGILQKDVFDAIKWTEHGFTVVDNVKDARDQGVVISARIAAGQFVIPSGLGPEEITQRLREINLTDDKVRLPALKGDADTEDVPLVAGHPGVCFPDKLGATLGVAQIGVHLTVYTKDTRGLRICVQERSEKASYAGKLDQTAAGGLQHNESVRGGLRRETKEELCEDIKKADYDGAVVFSTIRPEEAGKLAGAIEISTKACFSLSVSADWVAPMPVDKKVKGFQWLSVQEVLERLESGGFKPNCALVMISFLIAREVINKSHPGFDKLVRTLRAEIPFPLPEKLEEYTTNTVWKS